MIIKKDYFMYIVMVLSTNCCVSTICLVQFFTLDHGHTRSEGHQGNMVVVMQ